MTLEAGRPPATRSRTRREAYEGRSVLTPADAGTDDSVAGDTSHAHPRSEAVSRPRLRRILRHLSLSLLIANVVPGVLFAVCLATLGVWTALVAALAWCYGALGWRMATKRRLSGLLLLTATGLTIRTGFAFASGDTFVYFLQPVVTDGIVAAVFLVSLASARPVVSRLAADFYPMSHDVAKRPRVQRLFWHLTLLWATVCLGKAVVTLWLLLSLPLVSFVVVRNTVFLMVTITAVTATVSAATWVARKEGLLPATRPA